MILATIIGNNASLPYGFVKSLLDVRGFNHLWGIGLYVPDNRNRIWNIMRTNGQDLLFIDSDIVFTPKDVLKMQQHLEDKDIVTGVYVMQQKEKYSPLVMKKTNVGYELAPLEEKLFEVDACGAGFLGISSRVIEKLETPFTQFTNPLSGELFGEDLAFCVKAQEAGFKIWCNPEIKVGHIKTETKYA